MATLNLEAQKIATVLDSTFVPAVKWNKAYRELAASTEGSHDFGLGLERRDGTVSIFPTTVLPHTEEFAALNVQYIERILKFLLWQKGGYRIHLCGDDALAADIQAIYSPEGKRAFDFDFMGNKVYGKTMEFVVGPFTALPESKETTIPLGRNLDGNRIGFDLGGSDRKCAAVVDGKVVFTTEIEWDPYFETDPQYHIDGINDSLKRAAEHLPGGRVDAIGGSSAGVYVNSEVRAASLFRGISEENFEKYCRNIFFDVQKEWDNVPFDVVNDGEVTALAGSMSMEKNAVLGLAMGTSEAVGYVNPDGNITPWLNELAFAPIDYSETAPEDEWSGDIGCGVQYFSQQAVGRLIPAAGLDGDIDMSLKLPERLIKVQEFMAKGDDRARKIYETIGVYLGYAVAHYAEFYTIENMLILGRVTSGEGGEIIIEKALEVLNTEYPEIANSLDLRTPNEQDKRHGQAVAAASLPTLK